MKSRKHGFIPFTNLGLNQNSKHWKNKYINTPVTTSRTFFAGHHKTWHSVNKSTPSNIQ